MAKIGSIARAPEGTYALKVDEGWQLLVPAHPILPELNVEEVIYEPTVLGGLGPGSVVYCRGEVYSQTDYGAWELTGDYGDYSTQDILDSFPEDEIEVLRRG